MKYRKKKPSLHIIIPYDILIFYSSAVKFWS